MLVAKGILISMASSILVAIQCFTKFLACVFSEIVFGMT